MAEEETLLDMDDLDSLTLDGIEDAPEFLNPPSGRYKISVPKAEIYKRETDDGDVQGIRITYAVNETVELSNSADDQVPSGTLFSENFGIPDGLSYFKTRMKKLLGDNVDGIKVKEMLSALPELFGPDKDKQIAATLKHTVTKKDGNEYENTRFQRIEVIDKG